MSGISISSSYGGWSPLAAMRQHQADMASAMERLATGKRINHASDGPADVIAIENLKADSIVSVEQIEALERENHRLAAEEGAQSVVDDLVIELRGLTVSAANTAGMSDSERAAMQVEADSILQTIEFLSNTATYKGERLLEGMDPSHLGTVTVEDGEGNTTQYSLADLRTGGRLSLADGDMNLAARVAETAADGIASGRGSIGSQMRSNESRIRALVAQHEGTESVRSLIEDADFAAEVSRLVRAETLQKATIFVAAMGQHQKETVLSLLDGTRAARRGG